jgi:hypothetical protein
MPLDGGSNSIEAEMRLMSNNQSLLRTSIFNSSFNHTKFAHQDPGIRCVPRFDASDDLACLSSMLAHRQNIRKHHGKAAMPLHEAKERANRFVTKKHGETALSQDTWGRVWPF